MIEARGIDEIDRVVGQFYSAFDNRLGKTPALEHLAALFAPKALITRVAAAECDRWTVAEFVAPRAAMLTDGTLVDFHEWETSSETTVLGAIASRRSQYAKEGFRDGSGFEGGGRKLIQLHQEAGRWVISSILWEDDQPSDSLLSGWQVTPETLPNRATSVGHSQPRPTLNVALGLLPE